MKIQSTIFFLLLLVGCTKKEVENPAKYAGSYIGTIEVYRNGVLLQTIPSHTIIIHPATWGDYAISNNVITRSTAPIEQNVLRFDRALVGSGAVNIYEFGTGTFSNNTLTIEFYQEEETPATHTVTRSDKYYGVLTRY